MQFSHPLATQGFQFYHTNNGPCPYRSVGIWENLSFSTEHLSNELYVALLNQGFRRSGHSIYHPICQGCQRCVPIRVNAHAFTPNKSQRRTWKQNQDVVIQHRPLAFTPASFELYQRYQTQWHHAPDLPQEWEFRRFLLESPVETEMMEYFLGEELVGVGWVDCLPSLLSSVYFIFEPRYASRRLGVFSLLYEIQYCLRRGLDWLYLGYWVADSPKMKYKADYEPAELLIDQEWVPRSQ